MIAAAWCFCKGLLQVAAGSGLQMKQRRVCAILLLVDAVLMQGVECACEARAWFAVAG
jgi:hypothetical protein